MRLAMMALIVACVSLGCMRYTEGAAVATREPPHDVWQLVERAVASVPLTVQKMEDLLGVPMMDDSQSPVRWNGGPVRLGPSLHVEASSIGIRDGTWLFAGFDIEPNPCLRIDVVKAHYPSVKLTYGVTGHSVYEVFGWVVSYDWGELVFGMQVKDDCLAGFSLNPADSPKS
jgi:hypothetical protein